MAKCTSTADFRILTDLGRATLVLLLIAAGVSPGFGQILGKRTEKSNVSRNIHDPAVPPRAMAVVKFFEDIGFQIRDSWENDYLWKWDPDPSNPGIYKFMGGRFKARKEDAAIGLDIWFRNSILDPTYDDLDSQNIEYEVPTSFYDDEFRKIAPIPGRKYGVWLGNNISGPHAVICCGSINIRAINRDLQYHAGKPKDPETLQKVGAFLDSAPNYLAGIQGRLCAAGLCRCGPSAVPVQLYDGNPSYFGNFDFTDLEAAGSLSQRQEWIRTASKKAAAAREIRTGAVTDGLSLLVLRSEVPGLGQAVVSLKSSENPGGLYRLSDGPVTGEGHASVTVGAYEDRSSEPKKFWIIALYRPPKTFGKGKGERTAGIEIAFTSASETISKGTGEIRLVPPPVVLVHGTFDNPEACWDPEPKDRIPEAKETICQRLKSEGFRTFSTDWRDTNGQKDPSSFYYNRMAVWENKGGIHEALTTLRGEKTAVTQVDIVAHSQGGVIARMYARGKWSTAPLPEDDPHFKNPRACAASCEYHRRDNFAAGDIRRLITISTTHYGSDICRLFKTYAYFVDNRKLIGDPIVDFWDGMKTEAILALHPQREVDIFIMDSPSKSGVNPAKLRKLDIGYLFMAKDALWNKVMFLKDYVFTEGFSNQIPGSDELNNIMKTPIPAHAIACSADDNDMLTLNGGYYQQRLELMWWLSSANLLKEAFMRLDQPQDAEDLFARKQAEEILMGREAALAALSHPEDSAERALADPAELDAVRRRIAESSRLNAARLRSAAFGNSENDCTVRKESSLGGLKGNYITVLGNVLHGPATQFPKVQQRVVELLQNDGSLFDPNGFPDAGILPPAKHYTGPGVDPATNLPLPPQVPRRREAEAAAEKPPAAKPPIAEPPTVKKDPARPAREDGKPEAERLARVLPDGSLDLPFIGSKMRRQDGRIVISELGPQDPQKPTYLEVGAVLLSIFDLANGQEREAASLSMDELARILDPPNRDMAVILKFVLRNGETIELPHPGRLLKYP